MGAVFLVALGGALGAVCRYALSFLPLASPLPTLLTNVIGAFVMGLVVGLSEERPLLSPQTSLFLRVGLCGGFTTFSSFSLETIGLLDKAAYGLALLYSLMSVVSCLVALTAGRCLAVRMGGS